MPDPAGERKEVQSLGFFSAVHLGWGAMWEAPRKHCPRMIHAQISSEFIEYVQPFIGVGVQISKACALGGSPGASCARASAVAYRYLYVRREASASAHNDFLRCSGPPTFIEYMTFGRRV